MALGGKGSEYHRAGPGQGLCLVCAVSLLRGETKAGEAIRDSLSEVRGGVETEAGVVFQQSSVWQYDLFSKSRWFFLYMALIVVSPQQQQQHSRKSTQQRDQDVCEEYEIPGRCFRPPSASSLAELLFAAFPFAVRCSLGRC